MLCIFYVHLFRTLCCCFVLQSTGHALFSVVFTSYILFAVAQFEEPDLVKVFGPEYVEYTKTTPQYIPNLNSFRAYMTKKKVDD